MDAAREWTDGELERLERRMAREYAQAAREMRGRQEQALRDYARELEQRERALDDAPDATAAHEAWLRGQAAKLTRLGAMADQLAAAASGANRRASAMVNDSLPGIFAENANRAAFEVDGLVGRDTAFSLVDESTVRHLMGLGEGDVINREVVYEIEPGMEPVQSIRRAEFEEARDIRWNRQKFASAITQGILQGESIPDIVKRTDEIFNSNRKAAVRAARTACTSAENAGRVSSYRRADRLGIPLVQEWMATLDTRTRSSHRALDGEQVEVDGEFSNGCRYPGDPHGPASEVWNCRCTIRARVRGFEDERQEGRWSRLPEGTTYEKWRAGKPVTRAESYENEAGRVSSGWLAGADGGASGRMLEESRASKKSKRRAMTTNPVNLDYVKSDRFAEQFMSITEPKTRDAVVESARKMLEHRNRTVYEDLYVVERGTGDVLARKTHEKTPHAVRIPPRVIEMLDNMRKDSVIVMHNHPLSVPPSVADYVTCTHPAVSHGIIICHDGRAFSYSVTDSGRLHDAVKTADGWKRLDRTLSEMVEYFGNEDYDSVVVPTLEANYGITYQRLK